MFMDSIAYWIRPYNLIVRYWGCVMRGELDFENKAVVVTEIRPSKPKLRVYRFWSEKTLQDFAKQFRLIKFEKESDKTFSGDYYQD